MSTRTKEETRQRLHDRIRKKIRGSESRPRLAVHRSQAHIYAQVIDEAAHFLGRGGFQYHGRIKALADAAREAGLKF